MGRWIPPIEDTDKITHSKGKLIAHALNEAKERIGVDRYHPISDAIGLIAYNTNKGILCAKKEPYGWVVSCHKKLAQMSHLYRKPLIMYLASNDAFYSFDAVECLKGTTNMRGNQEMVNFDIKIGVNME